MTPDSGQIILIIKLPVVIQSCLFRQVFVNYMMSILIYANKQVGTSIKVSLWHSPSRRLVQKCKPEKLIFIVTNNWIKLAVWWPVKYFFAPNSSILRESFGKEEEEEEEEMAIVRLYAFQANASNEKSCVAKKMVTPKNGSNHEKLQ